MLRSVAISVYFECDSRLFKTYRSVVTHDIISKSHESFSQQSQSTFSKFKNIFTTKTFVACTVQVKKITRVRVSSSMFRVELFFQKQPTKNKN